MESPCAIGATGVYGVPNTFITQQWIAMEIAWHLSRIAKIRSVKVTWGTPNHWNIATDALFGGADFVIDLGPHWWWFNLSVEEVSEVLMLIVKSTPNFLALASESHA